MHVVIELIEGSPDCDARHELADRWVRVDAEGVDQRPTDSRPALDRVDDRGVAGVRGLLEPEAFVDPQLVGAERSPGAELPQPLFDDAEVAVKPRRFR